MDDWMRFADKVLEDEQLLTTVYEALTKRRPKSRTRGQAHPQLELDNGRVTFRWRDSRHGNQTKSMTLEAVEFIQALPITHLAFGVREDSPFRFPGQPQSLIRTCPLPPALECFITYRRPYPCCSFSLPVPALLRAARPMKKSSDVLKQAAIEGLRKELDTMAPRVQR